MSASCRVCGASRIHADGLCATCYRYRRRTGRNRSTADIIRANEAELEAELNAAWIRALTRQVG